MHVPTHFLETRSELLIEAIEKYPFAVVICGEGHVVPNISSLPLLFEPPLTGGNGTILGHAARNNPLMQDIAEVKTIVCVFQGPHTYISPRTYTEARNVPTWNHLDVYCRCKGSILPADQNMMALEQLVYAMEAGAWKMDDTDPTYVDGLSKGIHAFRLEILEWKGHFKMSQNKPAADVTKAAEALQANTSDPLAASSAAWMLRYLAERKPVQN